MGSACATKNQRSKGPARRRRLKGIEAMDTPARAPDASKLLAMTDNVVIRNRVFKRARRTGDESREYGRLNKSINDLAETAEKLRKAQQQGQVLPP